MDAAAPHVPRRASPTGGVMFFALLALSPIAMGQDARIRVFETSLRPAVSVAGEPQARWTLQERMAHYKVPGASVAVIRNGKLAWAKGYGVLQAGKPERVDVQTVFSVGSLSKVGAAAITLRLVDAGQLNLDRPVNEYIARWQLPDNRYTEARPVTLRGLLSHTSGLLVDNFPDFQPGEALPTLMDTLEGRAPAKTAPVRVMHLPGTRLEYSGGATQLEQLVIEETTGLDFPAAARRYLFEPLGMARSTYENPIPASHGNIAKAHRSNGEPRALPRGYEAMPEMAASGLWSTPSDYAMLVIALIHSYRGDAGGLLNTALARQMMTEVDPGTYGLGPELEGEGMQRRFTHSGGNDSYISWMEGHLGTGNGMVIFTNSRSGGHLNNEIRRAVALAEGWSDGLDYHLEVPPVQLTADELDECAGTYVGRSSFSAHRFHLGAEETPYRFVSRDGLLYREGEHGPTRLIPLDAMHFVDERGGAFYEFRRGYSGAVSGLIERKEGNLVRADKVNH